MDAFLGTFQGFLTQFHLKTVMQRNNTYLILHQNLIVTTLSLKLLITILKKFSFSTNITLELTQT